MDMRDIYAARAALELKLTEAFHVFESATNLRVASVDIQRIEVTRLEDSERRWAVSGCHVGVALPDREGWA